MMHDHSSCYPSLFVVTNSQKTQWYSVTETEMNLLDVLESPVERMSDSDSFGGHNDGGPSAKAGGPDMETKRHDQHEHDHFHAVGTKTAELAKEGSYVHISVVLPEQYKNEFADAVKKHLHDAEIVAVYGNHVGDSQEKLQSIFEKTLSATEGEVL